MYNIIFLDIDGVMLTGNDIKAMYEKTHRMTPSRSAFNEGALLRLRRLVNSVDARIIVSSTWRMDNEDMAFIIHELARVGISDKVIGTTPVMHCWRENEIESWLTNNERMVKSFIVIDDDSFDLQKYAHRLVHTKFDTGFTQSCFNQAVSLFEGA